MASKKAKAADPSEAAVLGIEKNQLRGAIGDRPLPMLRELGAARVILDDWLRELEGEETPELADLFEKLEGDTKQKVENWGLYLQDRDAQAALMKAEEDFYANEAKRLKERRESFEKGTERSRNQLLFQMDLQGIDEVEGAYCKVALQYNPPKLIGDIDPETLAAWFSGDDETYVGFVRYSPESFALDRNAVKAAATNLLIERLPAGLEMVRERKVVIK